MKGKTLLCLALVTSMLLSVFMIGPVGAQSTTIGVEPVDTIDHSLGPGSNFTVEIWIRDVSDLAGVDFDLGYNTTVLTATNITYGDIFGSNYWALWDEINDAAGWVKYSISEAIGEPSFYGDGRVAIINFTVDSYGDSILDLYLTKLADTPGTPIVHTVIDGFFSNIHIFLHAEAGLIDISDPEGTRWHELYPTYSHRYNLTSWADKEPSGNLSYCDYIQMKNLTHGTAEDWYHVYKVTVTINTTLLVMTSTRSPSSTSGSWTTGDGAYADGGTYANITSATPPAYQTYSGYGFNIHSGYTMTSVRVRYDAWGATPTITYVGAGAKGKGTGAVTPDLPANWAENDVFLLFCETANEEVTAPAGWTAVANSPQGTGTGGGTSATRLTVFWRRATASETAPTIADPGDHITCGILAFRGVTATGDPWDVTAGDVLATTSTSVTIPGATTTVDGCMVVVAVANMRDSNTESTSGWTNTDLAGLTERVDYQYNGGNGGGFGVATGTKSTAGSYGSTTATLATASVQGRISIALKPDTNIPKIRVDVSWDGGSTWSGYQETTLTTSETTYWYNVTSQTSWTPQKLNDTNFRVNASAVTSVFAAQVNLDWIPVEVKYGVSAPSFEFYDPTRRVYIQDFNWSNPLYTMWREIRPTFNRKWNLTGWTDNGSSLNLTVCDDIQLNGTATCHVDGISTDIVVKKLPYTPGIPEFPLETALPIALIIAVVYVWRTKKPKRNTRQQKPTSTISHSH